MNLRTCIDTSDYYITVLAVCSIYDLCYGNSDELPRPADWVVLFAGDYFQSVDGGPFVVGGQGRAEWQFAAPEGKFVEHFEGRRPGGRLSVQAGELW